MYILARMFSPEELKIVVRIVRRELCAKGGNARAKKLSKTRRKAIARQAAQTRWSKLRALAANEKTA